MAAATTAKLLAEHERFAREIPEGYTSPLVTLFRVAYVAAVVNPRHLVRPVGDETNGGFSNADWAAIAQFYCHLREFLPPAAGDLQRTDTIYITGRYRTPDGIQESRGPAPHLHDGRAAPAGNSPLRGGALRAEPGGARGAKSPVAAQPEVPAAREAA